LTLRCTDPTCARLIAFQKTLFRGDAYPSRMPPSATLVTPNQMGQLVCHNFACLSTEVHFAGATQIYAHH
jgi:hypothetical protein